MHLNPFDLSSLKTIYCSKGGRRGNAGTGRNAPRIYKEKRCLLRNELMGRCRCTGKTRDTRVRTANLKNIVAEEVEDPEKKRVLSRENSGPRKPGE